LDTKEGILYLQWGGGDVKMRNMNQELVEIVDEYGGPKDDKPIFKCKMCGEIWRPKIIPFSGGKLYWGAWECPNKCGYVEKDGEGIVTI